MAQLSVTKRITVKLSALIMTGYKSKQRDSPSKSQENTSQSLI